MSVASGVDRAVEHVDVLIVGAGLSGIGAAHHIATKTPWLTFAILEGRDAIGGTWDLFRYPGVRSDSDMFTLGYGFAMIISILGGIAWDISGKAIACARSPSPHATALAWRHGRPSSESQAGADGRG